MLKMNNTAKAETEKLVFNRLEKVGSTSMIALLYQLSHFNNFQAYSGKGLPKGTTLQNKKLQSEIVDQVSELDGAWSFTEHMNWINFTEFNKPRPVYINLIRHPIDRTISTYYYIRNPKVYAYYVEYQGWKMKDKEYFETSFNDCVRQAILNECNFENHVSSMRDWRRFASRLCGNNKICMHFNSESVARIAMRNIEQEYAVVGSWEDTNITLTVLEHYIPRFFRGATEIYYSNPKNFHKNETPHKTDLDPDIEEKLKVQFAFEIEVYNFAKQRLYTQYIAIKKHEMKQKFETKYLRR